MQGTFGPFRLMLDPAHNPGKNIIYRYVFHPTSIDLANPVSLVLSQEASSMLDLPLAPLAPRLKLILTRLLLTTFGLETIGREVNRVGQRDDLLFTPFAICTSVLLWIPVRAAWIPP